MATAIDVKETFEKADEALTVKRVFGEPYVRDGVTVIPAAKVQGGAGGGAGEGPEGQGSGTGTGYGLNAKPLGVYVLKDGDAVWRPAVDVNRLVLGMQVVAVAALLLIRAVVKARAKQLAVQTLMGEREHEITETL
jgi:uncharacterized spore protein YtfJ